MNRYFHKLGAIAGGALGSFRRKSDPRKVLLESMPRGSVCAEIGVFKGDFSAEILRIVRPRTLHLVDPWKYETSEEYKNSWYGGEAGGNQDQMDAVYNAVRERFRAEIASAQVRIYHMSSADAAARFRPSYLDWVYIDGNHLYEFVKRDLELYYPKIKHGGFLTGDDYGPGGWWNDGVQKAVDQFISLEGCTLVSTLGRQFVLQKPKKFATVKDHASGSSPKALASE
jgi:hypothetical protein